MSLAPQQASYDDKPRVNPKEGKHIARNYAIIDIGTHMESFQNQPAKPSPKVMMFWELPKSTHVFDEARGAEPHTVFCEYTNRASDKGNLCKVLKAWGKLKEHPKTLNLKPYLGKYCEINIFLEPSKKDPKKIYPKINDNGRDISPVQDSMTHPTTGEVIPIIDLKTRIPIGYTPFNKDVWFDLDNFTWEQFNSLPSFVQKKIMRCNEWNDIVAKNPKPIDGQVQQQDTAGVIVATQEDGEPDF